MDTNVVDAFLCQREELRVMYAAGCGAIVNMASTSGHVTTDKSVHYTASKHAVIGMTKSAAFEAASRGVRVNAVAVYAATFSPQSGQGAALAEGSAPWPVAPTVARWQPPDPQCNWMKVGGNVTSNTELLTCLAAGSVSSWLFGLRFMTILTVRLGKIDGDQNAARCASSGCLRIDTRGTSAIAKFGTIKASRPAWVDIGWALADALRPEPPGCA